MVSASTSVTKPYLYSRVASSSMVSVDVDMMRVASSLHASSSRLFDRFAASCTRRGYFSDGRRLTLTH